MSSTTKGSKVVYLRRAAMSIPEAQGDKDLKEYFDNAHRSLGSFWTKGSMRPGTGLTLKEENFLMPYILNIPQEDRDFREKVTTFFHEISTKIEPTTASGDGGTKLEIGLENNEESLSPTNLPLEVMDYVRYRHALAHPEIGLTEDATKGNQLKAYYIHNPEDVKSGNNTKTDLKDEALSAYLEVKKEAVKIKQYLTLLNVDPAAHKGQESIKLRELAEKTPKAFLTIYNDKDKDYKYFLSNLVAAKVVEEVGTRLLIKENGFQIGSNQKDAVAYLKDATNSKQVTIFKSMVQDWHRKKSPTLDEIEADDETEGTKTPVEATT